MAVTVWLCTHLAPSLPAPPVTPGVPPKMAGQEEEGEAIARGP